MFETTVISATNPNARRRRALLLPVAAALHVTAIGGAMFAAVWNVDLPENSPKQVATLSWTPRVETPVRVEPPRQTPPPKPRNDQPRSTPAPEREPQVRPIEQPPSPDQGQPAQFPPNSIPDTEPTEGTPGPVFGGGDEPGPGPLPPNDGAGPGTEPGDGKGPLTVGGHVKAPTILVKVTPAYPEFARRVGLRGFAVVECIVDRDGQVRDVRLVHASHPAFGPEAVNAVERWKFRPGLLNGKPVATVFQLRVAFELRQR